jgi:type I restriction enzyme S subunit
MKPLGELVKILKGSKASDVFDEPRPGAYPYLQIEDLRPDATPKYAIDKDGTLATRADVLIAWDGANAGTVSFDLEGYIGSTIAILRPTHDDIYAPYLGYFLQSKFNEIQENTTGATIPHINRDYLENLRLPLPPLPEQRRIADLLSRADRLRRLRRLGDSLSASLLSSVFLEMFGDPASNPKGWDLLFLEEIADVQGGLQVTTKRDSLKLRKPYLRVANVYRNKLDLSEIKMIGLTPSEFERTKLQKNDLLFVEGHGNINEIGRAAVWDGSIEDCVHQNHLIRARLNSKSANAIYVSHFINSTAGRKYFTNISNTTSGLNTISTNTVKSCPVPLPPLPQQEQFAAVVRRVEFLRARAGESERQVEGLFQSLLSQAFSS